MSLKVKSYENAKKGLLNSIISLKGETEQWRKPKARSKNFRGLLIHRKKQRSA